MANFFRRLSGIRLWLGLIIVLVLIASAFTDWIVEWLWMNDLGYSQVFWTIKLTQILLFVGALALALLYVLPNMHILAKRISYMRFGTSPLNDLNLNRFSPRQIRMAFYTFGVIFSVFFSFVFFTRWDAYFRFHWNEMVGKVDPIFNNDIGFYLFRLPFIEMIQNSFIVLVFFITLVLLVFYLSSGALNIQGGSAESYRSKAVRHLSINIGLWLLLMTWGYYLQRYDLLYSSSGIVYGASYTDIYVSLPVFWVMGILCLVLAGIAFSQLYRPNFRYLVIGAIITAAIGIVGQGILPVAIQKLVVEPNELELESPYIRYNIEQTRQAYKLDTFNEREYNARETLSFSKIQDNTETLQNIRLWDPRLLIQTYKQLQEIRLYYEFFNVDVDRYHTNEGYQQMMLSARELTSDLPSQADTWVNRHLQYTHGYGLVMSPVAKVGAQGDPRLVIKDLPPVTANNLNVDQAAIYYGEHDPGYKIVNTDIQELDYPSGDENVYTNYDGDGGVNIDNFFTKLLFAWEFGDFNILLTDYIRDGSKIQFWKSISERVQRIAPFLELEDNPYLVLSEGKLYWIQDAYTISPHYPYSERYERRFNYIRNSVKVVVDAYNGKVDFYVVDEDDPVLDVYRDIFPGMFKPLESLSPALKSHLRYPVNLFITQMEIFNTYHMTNPQTFYNNEDLWTRPNEKYAGQRTRMQPYYILSKLPGEDRLQYLLISPLTPNNRDNMIAWMAAKSDFPEYGEVEVFKLPKERLILGPAQIEAKIDQDTEISRQLTLWDQRGSNVIRGNLMVIPIEDSFIYVEPVFLIAEDVDIPQLQRVIATTGNQVVMEPTLDQAMESLFGQTTKEPLMVEQPNQRREVVSDTTLGVSALPSPELVKVRSLWREARQALRNGNWEQFGNSMKQIEELLGSE